MYLKSNYQSVSLTCILCKVFEKLIRNYIYTVINMVSSMVNQQCIIFESIDIINEYLVEGDNADIYIFGF